MTKRQEQFVKDVDDFLRKEGLTNLSYDSDEYPNGAVESHFSWSPCDCCGGVAGDRTTCSGYNPTTGEVQTGYSVCPSCECYLANGDIPEFQEEGD